LRALERRARRPGFAVAQPEAVARLDPDDAEACIGGEIRIVDVRGAEPRADAQHERVAVERCGAAQRQIEATEHGVARARWDGEGARGAVTAREGETQRTGFARECARRAAHERLPGRAGRVVRRRREQLGGGGDPRSSGEDERQGESRCESRAGNAARQWSVRHA
jgi:hypothetical protein